MTPILQARGLMPNMTGFNYEGNAIDVDLAPGETLSIIGPDYAGKSDWLRTLAGLHYPLQGSLRFEGREFHELDDEAWTRVRQKFAYVSCNTELLSAANGLANVMLPARYHRVGSTDEIEARAVDLATELGAAHSLYRLPYHARRDQRFKLAIARALILDPVLLFLDNPFVLLDTTVAGRFQANMLERVRRYDLALALVTYDLDFTLRYADRILFVTAERVYLFTSADELLASDVAAITDFLGKRSDS